MLLTVEGTTQPITEWALDYGIPCALIRSRLKRGWSEERAVTEPMRVIHSARLTAADMRDEPPPPRPVVPSPFPPLPPMRATADTSDRVRKRKPYAVRGYTYNDVTKSLKGWAEHLGISVQAMHARLKKSHGPSAFEPARVNKRRRKTPG